MKRTIFALILIALATPVLAQVTPICTPIPAERERDIQLATYAVAATVLAEPVGTAYHAQRLQLATLVANSPGAVWLQIADYSQGQVTTCEINWTTLTYTTMKTSISNNWTAIARLRFGPDVVGP